mmetsp:Transcript_8887/g.27624  ORF Transcript_8887/g.27624 Transcript_8887/m.27624 type:complete len:490 (-) Transcript_8887:58-1527(-)
MAISMQQVLLFAVAIKAGSVHVHLAPAASGRADTMLASGHTHTAVATTQVAAAALGGALLPDDALALRSLYLADGPVQAYAPEDSPDVNATAPHASREHPTAGGPAETDGSGSAARGATAKAARPTEDAAAALHPGRGWTRVLARMVAVLVFAAAVFGVFAMYGEQIRARTHIKVEHVCCAAYAALSISIDLSIKNAARVNGGRYPFNPACAVVTVEVLKLVASMVLFSVNARADLKQGRAIVLPGAADVAWLMVPGFVYTCNNMIVFQAIGHCPLGAFGVIRETMLIWNAVLWTLVFRAPIGRARWLSILLLFLGCIVNQLPTFFRSEFTLGVLWAFLLAFSNAAGGVANEYAMKRKAAMDINLQNCILYFFCGGFSMIYLLAFQMDDLRVGFFHGFSPQCIQVVVLQMLTGLAVSRILKYVDAVTKTIVAALRGPGVIFFGAWVFHTTLRASEVVATLVVCLACYIYLREGPLVKPKDEPVPAKSVK